MWDGSPQLLVDKKKSNARISRCFDGGIAPLSAAASCRIVPKSYKRKFTSCTCGQCGGGVDYATDNYWRAIDWTKLRRKTDGTDH